MDNVDLSKLIDMTKQPRGLFSINNNGEQYQIHFKAIVKNELKEQTVNGETLKTYADAKSAIFNIMVPGDFAVLDSNVYVMQNVDRSKN